MPITYLIDDGQGVVRAKGSRVVSDRDVLEYIHNLAEDPAHGPGMHQVVDLRGVGEVVVTPGGLRAAGLRTSRFSEALSGTRLAILVGDEHGYGMSRIFTAFAEPSMKRRVFLEEAEADAWIREDADGD